MLPPSVHIAGWLWAALSGEGLQTGTRLASCRQALCSHPLDLQLGPDRPNVHGTQRRLRADETAMIHGTLTGVGSPAAFSAHLMAMLV